MEFILMKNIKKPTKMKNANDDGNKRNNEKIVFKKQLSVRQNVKIR